MMLMRVTVAFDYEIDVHDRNYDVSMLYSTDVEPQIAAAILEEETLGNMPEALTELLNDGRPLKVDVVPVITTGEER